MYQQTSKQMSRTRIYNTNTNTNDDMHKDVIYETYYYIGEHIDGCDMDGPKYVYHYISESYLNGRNINEIEVWDCDLELWPGDKYWIEAGKHKNIIVEMKTDS